MGLPKRADLVIVSFPFSDLSGAKYRAPPPKEVGSLLTHPMDGSCKQIKNLPHVFALASRGAMRDAWRSCVFSTLSLTR